MASFTGTSAECVEFIHSHFEAMRVLVAAAKDSTEDKEGFDTLMETMGRTVYEVTVEPVLSDDGMPMVAPQRVRPDRAKRVARIETGIELFDIFTQSQQKDNYAEDAEE